METAQKELFDKVRIIASGPNRDLLLQFVDFLYEREGEYFSPEDLAAIEEGLAQIERGETISWEELFFTPSSQGPKTPGPDHRTPDS